MTPLLAAVVMIALGTTACRPSRGTNSPPDSGSPHVGTPALDDALTNRTELTLSVREVAEMPGLVRRRVRVTGVCVGYAAAGGTATPPLTRSDWILEDDGAQVFVSGPVPDSCTPTTRGTRPVTIVGEVAEDTLPPFPDGLPVTRRFLLRIR